MSANNTIRRLQQVQRNLTGSSASYRKKFRIAVVGSGNWGTAVAKIVAENAKEKQTLFEPEVRMWVREEKVHGRNLTEIINSEHENVRYLPGVTLPTNLVADPDVRNVAEAADIIVINIPHQFLKSVAEQMKGIDYSKKVAVSCLKGIDVTPKGPILLSDYIYETLGLHCGVLSGANIASEVAREKFSETTVALPKAPNFAEGDVDEPLIKELFQRPYFHVQVSVDIPGVSLGGALKNVVAIGAGLVEGAGWGDNAKAAVMRRGLLEMDKFGKMFFPNMKTETLMQESAGIADLITSCAGGRNLKVGREFARTGKPIDQIEQELLNGQSAQGLGTAKEVHLLLSNMKKLDEFPLFVTIYDVVFNGLSINELPNRIQE